MSTEIFTLIAGYTASICMVLGYLPQAIYTIRTRDTDGIALPTFLLMGIGSIMFVVQGFLTGNIPLVLCNLITSTCSAIVFFIKLFNDRKKRRSDKES